jgi:hypothetical protein
MSLENQIEALTEAVNRLVAALDTTTASVTPAVVEPEAKPEPKKTPVKEVAAPVKEVEAPVELDLPTIAAKFTDLVEKDRPAAVQLLKDFNLAKLGQAKTEQFGAIYAKTVELLNG